MMSKPTFLKRLILGACSSLVPSIIFVFLNLIIPINFTIWDIFIAWIISTIVVTLVTYSKGFFKD